MSVRHVERPSLLTGKKRKVWVIDIRRKDPFTGERIEYRKDSFIQTRRGAEDQERKVLNSIADGTYWDTFGKKEEDEKNEEDATQTRVDEFFGEFMKNHCQLLFQ